MIPLIKSYLHDLLYSPERAKLMLRSGATFAALMGVQLVMVPVDQMLAWTAKEWATWGT